MKLIRLNENDLNALSIGARESGYKFAIVPDEFKGDTGYERTSYHWESYVNSYVDQEAFVAEGLGDTPEEAWKEARENV